MKLALIDVGSSTVKLNVYEADEKTKTYNLIRKGSQTTKLAEGMKEAGDILQDLPMARTVNCIKDFLQTAQGVQKILIFSTSAMRRAKNTQDFRGFVKGETGQELRVITEKEEAEVFFNGVTQDFSSTGPFLAINIGGGSTEVSYGYKDKLSYAKSLPIGVVSINETFLKSDPPTDAEYNQACSRVEEVLREHKIGLSGEQKDLIFLHTGGELSYIKRVKCPNEKSNLSPSHPIHVQMDAFEIFSEGLRKKPKKELEAYFPENPLWMSGAIASNLIALSVAKAIGANYFVPSDKNLSDGLVLEVLGLL